MTHVLLAERSGSGRCMHSVPRGLPAALAQVAVVACLAVLGMWLGSTLTSPGRTPDRHRAGASEYLLAVPPAGVGSRDADRPTLSSSTTDDLFGQMDQRRAALSAVRERECVCVHDTAHDTGVNITVSWESIRATCAQPDTTISHRERQHFRCSCPSQPRKHGSGAPRVGLFVLPGAVWAGLRSRAFGDEWDLAAHLLNDSCGSTYFPLPYAVTAFELYEELLSTRAQAAHGFLMTPFYAATDEVDAALHGHLLCALAEHVVATGRRMDNRQNVQRTLSVADAFKRAQACVPPQRGKNATESPPAVTTSRLSPSHRSRGDEFRSILSELEASANSLRTLSLLSNREAAIPATRTQQLLQINTRLQAHSILAGLRAALDLLVRSTTYDSMLMAGYRMRCDRPLACRNDAELGNFPPNDARDYLRKWVPTGTRCIVSIHEAAMAPFVRSAGRNGAARSFATCALGAGQVAGGAEGDGPAPSALKALLCKAVAGAAALRSSHSSASCANNFDHVWLTPLQMDTSWAYLSQQLASSVPVISLSDPPALADGASGPYAKYYYPHHQLPDSIRNNDAAAIKHHLIPQRTHASVYQMLTVYNVLIDPRGITYTNQSAGYVRVPGHAPIEMLHHFHVRTCAPKTPKPAGDRPAPSSIQHVDEAIILFHEYGGGNFYHWLVETLARISPLLSFLHRHPNIRIFVDEVSCRRMQEAAARSPRAPETEEFHVSSAELLGLAPERFICGHVFARVVHVPEGFFCSVPYPIPLALARDALRAAVGRPPASYAHVQGRLRSPTLSKPSMRHAFLSPPLHAFLSHLPEAGHLPPRVPDPARPMAAFGRRACTCKAPDSRRELNVLVLKRGLAKGRTLVNHADVVESLNAAGYAVSVMDDHKLPPLLDVLVAFADVDVVVAPHGAGLANVLASSPGTCLIEILPQGHPALFYLAMAVLLDFDYHNVLVPGNKSSSLVAPVGTVLEAATKCGAVVCGRRCGALGAPGNSD